MAQHRRMISRLAIFTLLGVGAVAGMLAGPYLLSKVTYAIEGGQAPLTPEQLGVANELSQAFQQVARTLRPSVVSVSSTTRVRVNRPQARRYGSEMPEELRRYFGGDDPFERFFDAPSAPQGYEQHGLGTGVIVSSDGYILTNSHVVRGADEVTVRLSDKRELPAKVVGMDKATDVAVVKIEESGLQAATLGDSSQLQVGQWALAMGSPFGLEQTVTAGIVSAVGRANVGITDYEDFIQTDAAINPGNSGGPLVNIRGEVMGINTAIASRSGGYQGIGFAIPSNMARRVMESIIQDGQVTRGFLGALIQDLTEDLAQSFGYSSNEGVLVGDVVPDGPAAKAGMKAGDIVITFNGEKATNANQLRNAVAATAPATKMKIEVYRDGKQKTLSVEVGKLEADRVTQVGPGAASSDELGMDVETLRPNIARQLGYQDDMAGVVVTKVDPSGLAAHAGISPGDVVVAIGAKEINSTAQFRETMRNVDPKVGVRMQVLRDGVRRFVLLRSR